MCLRVFEMHGKEGQTAPSSCSPSSLLHLSAPSPFACATWQANGDVKRGGSMQTVFACSLPSCCVVLTCAHPVGTPFPVRHTCACRVRHPVSYPSVCGVHPTSAQTGNGVRCAKVRPLRPTHVRERSTRMGVCPPPPLPFVLRVRGGELGRRHRPPLLPFLLMQTGCGVGGAPIRAWAGDVWKGGCGREDGTWARKWRGRYPSVCVRRGTQTGPRRNAPLPSPFRPAPLRAQGPRTTRGRYANRGGGDYSSGTPSRSDRGVTRTRGTRLRTTPRAVPRA